MYQLGRCAWHLKQTLRMASKEEEILFNKGKATLGKHQSFRHSPIETADLGFAKEGEKNTPLTVFESVSTF